MAGVPVSAMNPNNERYKYEFDVLNEDCNLRQRIVYSLLSPLQRQMLFEVGYLMIEDVFQTVALEELRKGVDDLRERRYPDSFRSTYSSSSFAGQYLREPHAYDERFWLLLDREPIIDSVRSVLGPRIVMRSYSIRITFPGTNAGTKWHSDQRSLVWPPPPLFTDPQVITCLLYLDDVNDANGPLYLMPGSQRWFRIPPADKKHEDLEGQVKLCPRSGTLVFTHSSLWHRGGPNTQDGSMRRLIIQQFAPAYMKQSKFEGLPDNPLYGPLIQKALNEREEETLELFGLGGYM